MFPFAFKAILDKFILDPSTEVGEYNNMQRAEHPKALELQAGPASSARKSAALPASQPELPHTAVAAPQSPKGRHSSSRNKRTIEVSAVGPRTTRAATQQQAPVPPTAQPSSRRSEPTEAQPAPVAAPREPKKRARTSDIAIDAPRTKRGRGEGSQYTTATAAQPFRYSDGDLAYTHSLFERVHSGTMTKQNCFETAATKLNRAISAIRTLWYKYWSRKAAQGIAQVSGSSNPSGSKTHTKQTGATPISRTPATAAVPTSRQPSAPASSERADYDAALEDAWSRIQSGKADRAACAKDLSERFGRALDTIRHRFRVLSKRPPAAKKGVRTAADSRGTSRGTASKAARSGGSGASKSVLSAPNRERFLSKTARGKRQAVPPIRYRLAIGEGSAGGEAAGTDSTGAPYHTPAAGAGAGGNSGAEGSDSTGDRESGSESAEEDHTHGEYYFGDYHGGNERYDTQAYTCAPRLTRLDGPEEVYMSGEELDAVF
jgi:hypothetical protein